MPSLTSTTGKWQPYGGAVSTEANVQLRIQRLRANIVANATIRISHIDDLQQLVTALWSHQHTTVDYKKRQEYGDGREGEATGLPGTYVYTNGSTDNNYISWLNTYSVWEGNGNYYWVAYFATTRDYTFDFACDDYGDMYIDGNIIMTLSSGADNYRVGKSITLQVSAGWHVIRIEANNSSGKAAIGARIYTTNAATPIWNTRSPIDPPVPAQGNVSSGFLGGNQRAGTEVITNKTTSNILVGGTQEGQTLTLEYAVPGTYTLSVPPGAKVQALIIGAGGGGAGGDRTSTTSPIGGGGGAGGYYGSTNTSVNNLRPIDVRTASITTNLASGNWYEANENSIYARPTWSANMKEYAVWSSVDVVPNSEIVSQRAFYAPYTGTYYISGAADDTMEVTIQGNAYNAASGHILSATSGTQFFNNWKPIQLEAGQIPLLFTNRVGAAAYGGFFLVIADSIGKGGRPGSGSGNNAVGQMVWKPRDYLTATIYDVITKPTWYPVSNSGWSAWMNSYAVWPQPYRESYKAYWMKQDIFLPYADTYTFERLADDVFYLYRYNTNNTYAGYVFTDYGWSAYQASPRQTKITLSAGINTFAFYVINYPGPGGFALVIRDSRNNIIWTTRTPSTLATTGVADSQVTELITTGDTLTIQVGAGGTAGNVRQRGNDGGDSFVSAVDGTRYYYGYGGKGGNIRGQFGAGGNVSANLAANVNTTTFGNTTISYTLGAGGPGGLGGVTGGGAGATSFVVAKQGAQRTGGGGGAGGAFTDDDGTSAGAAGGKGSLYTQTKDSKIAGPGGGGGGAGAVGYINRASWKNLGTDPGLIAFYPDTSAGGILEDVIDNTASGALGAGASAQVMPDTGFPAIRFTGATNSYVMVNDIDKLRLVKTTDTSFTVEAWVYATGNGTAGTYGGMIINKDSEFEITRMVDGRIAVAIDWGSENNNPDRTLPGSGWIIPPAGSCVVPLKTATHVALTVSGTTMRIYINGRAQILEVVDGPVAGQKINQYFKSISRFPRDDRKNMFIGARSTTGGQNFDGFIAGVRIWNRARSAQQIFDHLYSLAPEGGFGGSYTGGGFFTGASFYFDGSGDNLTVAGTGGQFQFGGDFTVECWMNQINRAYYSTLFEIGTYTNGILFRPGLETNNFYINNVNYGDLSANVALGTWNHVALSRTGVVTKLHVNGNKVWQGNVSGIINSNNGALRIGQSNHAGGQFFNGYVTNFRVVKGKAVYTQDSFPVPTSPFANIEGTVFLGIQRNVTQDLGPFNLTITSAGDVKPDTFSPFASGARVFDEYSAVFDGNGDYVTVPYTAQFAHPTTWTMEMWLYPNSFNTANNQYWNSLVTRRPNGGYYAPYVIGLRNGRVQAYMSTTGSSWNLGPAETDKLFDRPGTFTWTAPPGVTSVCVVCIGGGGSGYQGPYGGVAGGDSWFINTGTVRGLGGGAGQQNSGGAGGQYTGDGGGVGGFGGSGYEGGGGGAGGYTGPGGNGSVRPRNSSAGSGGGGSGGTGSNGGVGGGGGGTGVFGAGSNGAFRNYNGATIGVAGLGGSGGNNGSARSETTGGRWYCAGGGCYCNWWYFPGYTYYYSDGGGYGGGAGGDFSGWGGGGGGLAWKNNITVVPGRNYTVQVGAGGYATGSNNYSRGAGGAVRIIWGAGRAFPSTNAHDIDRQVNVNNGGIDGGIKTANSIPLKQWTHVAITRKNRDVAIWVDGQVAASGTLTDNNPNWNVGWPTVIGNNGYSVPTNENYFYDGYICNLRITNGIALYNDNFGVPQAPLPRLAGTALLTFQDPTIKDKADTRTNMTVFGDAKMQTFSPFQQVNTGAAAFFDGDGDYLRVGNDSGDDGFQFGNVSFTVEGWMNTTKPPVGNISMANANVLSYSSIISSWAPTTAVAEANFAIPGDYTWKCPAGVTSVSVMCIGGGSSGFTRAGYISGTTSFFVSPTTVAGLGGNGFSGGGFVGNSVAFSNVTIGVAANVATGTVQVASSNYNATTDQLQSYVSINGQTYRSSINPLNTTSRRGHTVTVIDPLNNSVISVNTYDTFASGSASLSTALNALANGSFVVLSSFDATALSADTRTVLTNSFGGNANASTWGSSRVSHIFIGVKNGATAPVEIISSASGSPGIITSTTRYRTVATANAGGGGGRGGDGGVGYNTGGGGAGGYTGAGGNGGGAQGATAAESRYTTPGTYQWTCPVGVTSISVVCVGAGGSGGAAYWAGGGGGGGGLGYKNNIPVTPGQQYTVTVGAGGQGVSATSGGQGTAGGDSWFIATNYVRGIGGQPGVGTDTNTNTPYAGGAGGGFVGDGGGTGGAGGTSQGDTSGGGGAAGGYGGNGGRGGGVTSGIFTNGAGGAGSGGAHGGNNSATGAAQSGGGTGLFGIARSGAAAGQGGSGGTNGSGNGTSGGSAAKGGFPGGGGGGQSNDSKSTPGCNGGDGAVRIIWPGDTRAFPNNNTNEINETVGVAAEQLFVQPGTYTWICPPNVFNINALVVGGGASGNLGSGISNGGQSYFIDTSTVRANGGQGTAGGTANQAGGANGVAFTGGAGGQQTGGGGGGGGAAGYAGAGGAGGGVNTNNRFTSVPVTSAEGAGNGSNGITYYRNLTQYGPSRVLDGTGAAYNNGWYSDPVSLGGPTNPILILNMASGRPAVNAYRLYGNNDNAIEISPKDWTFQGAQSNTGPWITLDTRTNQTGWNVNNGAYFESVFNNGTAYLFYRFNITGWNNNLGTWNNYPSTGRDYVGISEVQLFQAQLIAGTASSGQGGAGGGGGATIQNSATAMGGGGGGTGLYGIGPNGAGGASFNYSIINSGIAAGNVTVSASHYNSSFSANTAFVRVNGVTVPFSISRGHTVMVINETTFDVESAVTYDTYGDGQAANRMDAALRGVGDQEVADGRLVAITTFDATAMPAFLRGTLRTYVGSTFTDTWEASRVSHALIGIKQPYNSSGNPISATELVSAASGTAGTISFTVSFGLNSGSGGEGGSRSQLSLPTGTNGVTQANLSQGGFPGGGGGGINSLFGGGGGGLAYRNSVPVTPGTSYTVVVGAGGTTTVGSRTSKGGNGAVRLMWGGLRAFPSNDAGLINNQPQYAASSGTGGSASGGNGSSNVGVFAVGGPGGGTQIFGQGESGTAPAFGGEPIGKAGDGGSGGQDGKVISQVVVGNDRVVNVTQTTAQGGFPGGGGGSSYGGRGGGGGGLGYINNYAVTPGQSYLVSVGRGGTSSSENFTSKGGNGAVRIIWPGTTRQFPTANTGVVTSTVVEQGWGVDLDSQGRLVGYASTGAKITGTRKVTDGQWHHFALVRFGASDLRLYVDGKLDAQGTQNFIVDNDNNLRIGAQVTNNVLTKWYYGYLSNIRVQKGVAEYLEDFSPNTTNFQNTSKTSLLTLQDPQWRDRSNKVQKVTAFGNSEIRKHSPFQATTSTSYSAHFDGQGDFLDVSGTSNFILPGDFTIECWTYETQPREGQLVIFEFGTYNNGMFLAVHGAGHHDNNFAENTGLDGDFYINGINFGSIHGVALNRWNHFVVIRAGTAVKLYINGTETISATYKGTINTRHADLRIGAARYERVGTRGAHSFFSGYISNFRITRGIAAYNGDVSAVIDRNNSYFFDGSNDRITTPANSDFYFSNMNFCIEMWIMPNFIPASRKTIFGQWNPTTNDFNFRLTMETDGSVRYTQKMTTGDFVLDSTGGFPPCEPGKWYHVAVIANGLQVAMFVEGVRTNLSTFSGEALNSSALVTLGSNADNTDNFTGYISSLRVVRNTIRTTEVTPVVSGEDAPYNMLQEQIIEPHEPLRMVSQTVLLTAQQPEIVDERGKPMSIGGGTPRSIDVGPFGKHQGLNTNTLTSIIPVPQTKLTATTSTSLGNSVYFDGTADYLTLADSNDWALGSNNDYVVEFWVNPSVIPTTGNYTVLFAQWSDAAATSNRSFKVTLSEITQGKIAYTHQTGSGPDTLETATVLKANRWYHIVITSSARGYYWYSRRQVEIYVNGVRDATSPEVNSGYNSSLPLAIGADSAGNRKFRGYISNLRFVNENYTRVYRYGWSAYLYYYYGWSPRPARVSVPSAPLQATTGTRLLALGATRIIDTSSGKKTITAYGTPSVSTYSPFSHSVVYSNEFDGSGDYIQADGALSSFTTATSQFTIEFFWYQDSPLDNNPATVGITRKTVQAGEQQVQGILVLQSNILRVNDVVYSHGITFRQNVWQHVAITYDASRVRVYVDGILRFTTPTTLTFNVATLAQCNFTVGARFWTSNGSTGTGPNNFINGYISNLRVASKVVYTGTPFAVSLEPLETSQKANPRGNTAALLVAETKLLTCQGEILTDYSTSAVTVTASGDVIERDFSPFSFSKMYSTQFYGNGHIRADSSLSSYTKTTDAFTVEFWWYSTVNVTNAMAPFCISPFTVSASRAANNLVLFSDRIVLKGVGYNHNIPFSDNVWTHVAITYDGNFVKIYKNGVRGWTSPDLINFIPFYECVLGIGCDFDSSDGGSPQEYITGYLSNFRMTQKVVYTGNFKLPPEPLHATQNQDTNIASIGRNECTLLTCQSEAIVDNSEPSDRIESRGLTTAGKPKPINESPYALRPGNNQSIFALTGDSGNGGGMTGTVLLTCHDKSLYDGSASGRTVKTHGDTYTSEFSRFAQGKGLQNPNSSPFKAGAQSGYSSYFDGIGDYITIPDSPYLELKAQDFTIECWIMTEARNTQSYSGITSKRANSSIYGAFVIALYQNVLRVWMSTGGNTWQVAINTNFLVKYQTWYHISVNRSGGQIRVYVNGVLVGSSNISGALVDNTARLTIGACSADGAWDFTGWISNFRFVVGKCLYTTQYKVPTAPLTAVTGTSLLTLQTRQFADYSSYKWKGTTYGNVAMTSFSPFASTIVQEKENDYDGAGASTYFDGISTRFQVQNTEALQIKTQPSTIEFWMYPERQDGDRRIATATLGNLVANVFAIGYADNRFGLIGVNNDPISWMSIPVTSENYPRINAWNHIAWVGSTTKEELYVNGQRVASSSNAYNYTDAVRFIGGYDQGSQAAYFQGHMTNFRTVLGTAVYRDDKFTVPQAPLENYSSGTGLLTFQNEAVVDNSPNSFDITGFGTTSPRHFSPFKLEDVETKAAPRDTLVTNGGVGGNGGLYGGGGGGNGGTVGTYGTSGAGQGASSKSSAVDGRAGTGAGGGGGFHTGSKGVFRFINNQVVGNRSTDGGVRSGGGDGATANIYTDNCTFASGGTSPNPTLGVKAGPGGGGGGSAGVDGQGGGDGGLYGGGGGGDSKGRFAGTGYGGQGLVVFKYNNTAGNEITKLLTTVGRYTWNVPNDFVSFVSVECIGGGGAGAFGGDYGAGGGGGAYAASINVTGLTPNRTVYVRVGRKGEPNTGVEATWSWFNTQPYDVGSEIDTIPLDSTQGALADYGRNASGVTVGLGGQADNSIGDVRFTGGRGGTSFAFESCGGGGGAAGPVGNGGRGGNSAQQPSTSGGGGGGSNGGGNAQPGVLLVGGAGGNGAVIQGIVGGLGAQGIIIFNYFKVGDFQPQTIFITNTSQRIFRVPSNFLRLISIEAIGAGGNGFTAYNDVSAHGGGGGAYARTTNVPVLVANRECYINVGSAYDESGRDSWFNASINSRPANANQGVVAKGGNNGGPRSIGLGGQAGQSIGETRFSGGNGGRCSLNLGASGGGGSAGPNGDGQVGGDTFTTNSLFVPTSGGGGGGSNGGGRGGVGLIDAGGPGGGGDVNQNANGVNGEETIVQYQGSTLTAGGGRGGQFNNSQPGLGGNGVGGDVNSRGGQGSGAKGNTGGSGGGAVGGGNAITDAGNAGDPGAAALDVSGLGTVLRLLNVNFQANGAGKGAPAGQASTQNLNRGGNAVQFGAGGGGAGYWGGDGGDGLYGGGGGGGAGYSDTQRGGKGGEGVLVAQFENGTPNVAIITSGTTYTVPARTSAVKLWVVGAGGGGAGASASNGTAGGGGGAGALVIKTFSSNINLAGTFTSAAGAPGTSIGRGGASIFPDNALNNGRPGTLGIPDGTPGVFGGGGAGGFAANAQQIEYAGTKGGDGYVKLVITNYAQPGRPETMPNIIQRSSTFSSDAGNIVIRAAHVNNMYQNLVGWAGSTHTHDVSDEY